MFSTEMFLQSNFKFWMSSEQLLDLSSNPVRCWEKHETKYKRVVFEVVLSFHFITKADNLIGHMFLFYDQASD